MRRIAERHGGHVSLQQLHSCGLNAKQIHLRKKRGVLVPVLSGVFRVGGASNSLETRLHAVALWMGDDGVFNAATSAHLYGLEGIEPPRRISVARYSGVSGPPWIKVTRIAADSVRSMRWVNGFRVCSVEQALAECCAVLPARQVGRALDDALRRGLTTLDRLWKFADQMGKGRRGAVVFRSLLRGRDERDERVRSTFESKMLAILRRIRGHHFFADYEIKFDDSRYFVDFYLPNAALGIECHSLKWHVGRHDADARRDRRIRSLGIELLYFTWDDVCHHADEVEKEIRAAIKRRLATSSTKIPYQGRIVEKKA